MYISYHSGIIHMRTIPGVRMLYPYLHIWNPSFNLTYLETKHQLMGRLIIHDPRINIEQALPLCICIVFVTAYVHPGIYSIYIYNICIYSVHICILLYHTCWYALQFNVQCHI